MATRAILTHQPEVECDVCGRRLLRGERPDTFLASGHSRTVCELCVPRATHVGWRRASDAQAEGASMTRGRAGRSLIGRLRQRRSQVDGQEAEVELHDESAASMLERSEGGLYDRGWAGGQHLDLEDDDEHLYSGAYAGAVPEGSAPEAGGAPEGAAEDTEPQDLGEPHDFGEAIAEEHAVVAASAEVIAALESFNASECATRIAGIARALGEPCVNVRQLEGADRKVAITIAWELCWYRYEVDLRSEPVTIGVVAEGMELDELPTEDRVGNAGASERGELSLLL